MNVKKLLVGAAATLMMVSMSGCSVFSSGNGTHEPTELKDIEPVVKAKISWETNVGANESGLLIPAVTETAVYAAGDKHLYRLEPTDGKKVWSVQTLDKVTAGVGSDGIYIALVSLGGTLEVYDVQGKRLWDVALSSDTTIPPLVGHGLIVVKTSDTRISAFDAASGQRVWHYQVQSPSLTLRDFKQMTWSPAGILVGQANGRLLALSPEGKPVFDIPVAEPHGITEVERLIDIVGRPWVDQQLMCAAAFQGKLTCMNSMNAAYVWDTKVDAVTGPVSDAQMLYVVDASGRIHAYNRQNGMQAWVNEDLLYRSPSTPIRIGVTVAVGDYDGYVTMMVPANGTPAARIRLDGAIRAPAVQLGYGAVYQTTKGQVAYLLEEPLA